MLIYLLPAIATFALGLYSINQDDETEYTSETLGFLVLITLLWPIALPFMLQKRIQSLSAFLSHQLIVDDGKVS